MNEDPATTDQYQPPVEPDRWQPPQPQQLAPVQPVAPAQPAPQSVGVINDGQPQPQAMPMPMQPVAQPAHQVPAQPAYQVPAKKGLSKGALWGIIGGAVGFFLLIAMIVVGVILLSGPSKDDYKRAEDKLNEATSAYNNMSKFSYFSTYGETETTLKNSAENIRSNQKKINSTLEELGDMKAVKSDKDVKQKFDNLNSKTADFNKAADALVEYYTVIGPIVLSFEGFADRTTSKETLMQEFAKLRNQFEDAELTNKHNITYADEMASWLKRVEGVVSRYIDMQASGDYDSSLSTEYFNIMDEPTSFSKSYSSNIEEMLKTANIRDELSSLGSTIFNQYLKKK